MEKKCSRCQQQKNTEEFSPSKFTKDGYMYYCRECMRAYKRAEYEKDKDKYKARARRTWNRNRNVIKELKTDKPCMDCKEVYHQYVMDFDHVTGDKVKAVSHLANGYGSLEKIITEVEKCELVCSNCHRYRTYNRLHPEDTVVNPKLIPN